jgi:hypothetical protein
LLRYIYDAENVDFLGPPGVAKSHLAVAIGIEAVQAGLSVYFANAGILLERLKKANSEGLFEDKLWSKRYEKTSTILRRINLMTIGVRYSMIRLLLQLCWKGFCITVPRSISKEKAADLKIERNTS